MTTAKTNGSAHVCTSEDAAPMTWQYPVGELANLIVARINELARAAENNITMSITFEDACRWPRNLPPANWPGQHAVQLPPSARASDATAKDCYSLSLSDSVITKDDQGRTVAFYHRHDHSFDKKKWSCRDIRYDAQGIEWSRRFPAVTDDFGWLVEAPTC